MKKNMGVFDRTIRTIIAAIGSLLVYLGLVQVSSAYVLMTVVAIFVLTSIVGFCPFYGVFGLHTNLLKINNLINILCIHFIPWSIGVTEL